MLAQFRDPSLSLWQSAIDETIRDANPGWTLRPSLAGTDNAGSILREVARHCAAIAGEIPLAHLLSSDPIFAKLLGLPSANTVHEQISYCSALYLSKAKALASGDANELANVEAQLNFGSCDPKYALAVAKYVQYFEARRKPIPYIAPASPDDSVVPIDDEKKCTIALVGDWGTGQQPAKTVLQRIAQRKPDIVIHLGDIYYSGTTYEAQNYFLKMFENVFETGGNNFGNKGTPRVFTMAGNHDMYAGGSGYYWLLKQLGQNASYFSLRNKYWRFVAVDTGFNDHDPLTVNSTTTRIQDQELNWLKAQVEGAGDAKTVLLSHHPLFSAFEDIDSKPVNDPLLRQVRELLPRITAWYWAHEHNLVIYKEYLNIHARLVGHGAFPVGIKELSAPKHPIPFYENVVLGNDGTCFNHGYALITLDGPKGTADYYECGAAEDKLNHTEQLNSLP
jgi:Calcineurin-like phosphoesterase